MAPDGRDHHEMRADREQRGVGLDPPQHLHEQCPVGGILDAWLVDTADAGTEVDGVRVVDCPLWMSDVDTTAAMVRAALTAAGLDV